MESLAIKNTVRAADKVFRWGGEELLVVLPHTNLDDACVVAKKIRLAAASLSHPQVGQVTISLGVAEHFPREPKEIWFKRTDVSLLRAKQGGRNRVSSWAPACPGRQILPLHPLTPCSGKVFNFLTEEDRHFACLSGKRSL
ncbi:MAG: GGDEF domain-containing protein [Eubacteriales bacterium]|nr:GGDEF domain-containing protein [Eubacteriales bacterium]